MKRNTILAKIGGYSEADDDSCDGQCRGLIAQRARKVTENDLRQVMDTWKPLLHKWKQVFSDFDLGEI